MFLFAGIGYRMSVYHIASLFIQAAGASASTTTGVGGSAKAEDTAKAAQSAPADVAKYDSRETPKLAESSMTLAAEIGFSQEQMARMIQAAVSTKPGDVSRNLETKSDASGTGRSAAAEGPSDDVTLEKGAGEEAGQPGGDGRPSGDVSAGGAEVRLVRLKNQLRLTLHQEGPCAFASLPGKYAKVVGHPLKLAEFGLKKLQVSQYLRSPRWSTLQPNRPRFT